MTLLDKQFNPGVRISGAKYGVADLETTGAVTGDVIVFNGTTAQWGTPGFFTVSGTLSSADILAFSTPVVILPTTAPGFAYLVTRWSVKFNPGTTPYTLAPGYAFRLVSTGTFGATVFSNIAASNFLDNVSTITRSTVTGGIVGFTLQPSGDLHWVGVGGNPTLGDGTVSYEIDYQLIAL